MLFIKALDPTKIKFGYAFESSWSPIARPVTCTRTNGNVVFEVDNISIIEYFKTYLGENFIETLNSTMYKYSLIANLGGEEEKFVKIFDPATTIIYENGGDIDKFIGDAIFAVFPDSESAFKSALLIQRTVNFR